MPAPDRPSPIGQRLARSLRAGALQAALLYLACLVVFLWEPLSRYGEVHFSSADLTQACSLTCIRPGHRPGNQLQSDAVTQMQPWLMLNRQELAAGRLPLWNPWNGAGTPHMANYQSAVASPFSLPFYVLGFKAALLASAALKLLALGLFTYLFLREIELAHVPALLGGLVFMFSGHNVLLLSFPHVGALSVLPAGLFCVERALRRFELGLAARRAVPLFGPLCGLSLALLAGLLAGNPEPFYFGALFVAAWTAARMAALALDRRAAWPDLARFSGKLACAAAIALGLAAFQLLPFLEYLEHSRVAEQRAFRQTPLSGEFWPLLVFPDVLGNPASPYNISEEVPPPNYELVNMVYTGGLALLLAVLAPLFLWRERVVVFFALAAALWIAYAYDVLGAWDLFAWFPTLARAPPNRSQGLWCFAVACLAALLVDRAARAARPAWLACALLPSAGAAVLVAALIGADRLIERFATYPSPNHERFLEFVPAHLAWMSALLLCGALAAAMLWVARARRTRLVLELAIACAAFLQTGHLLRHYNPVCEDRFFFPVTPAIETLRRHVGNERVAILGEDTLPPDSNIRYGIASIASYDGLWVRDLDLLYRDQFGDSNNWRPILHASEPGLKLFGVQWVLAKWDWNFVDSGLAGLLPEYGQKLLRLELLPERPVAQTFRSERRGLQAVMAVLSAHPSSRPCPLRARLRDVESGETVFERTLARNEVRASAYEHSVWPNDPQLDPPGRPVVFRFDPIARSAGRTYELVLECPDGLPGDTIMAWSRPLLAYGDGAATHGRQRLTGELLFDFSFSYHRFEKVAQVAQHSLLRYLGSLSRWWMVGDAVVAEGEEAALALLRSPSFNPRTLVVLAGDDPVAAGIKAGLVVSDPARRRLVKFTDSEYCYLVSEDGTALVHIDDEATFLLNKFSWDQIQHLPPAERARFTIVPDTDVAEKRRHGLRLVTPPADAARELELVEETPTRLRWRVRRADPGYLVVSLAHVPGWVARLNGAQTPVLRANFAFDAIAIPAGSWEVELAYEPASLRRGLWAGAASLLAGAAALALSRRRPRWQLTAR